MRRRRIPKPRRPGFLVRLMDDDRETPASYERTLLTLRSAYLWAQNQIQISNFKNPHVVIYHLVDTVRANHGSYRAARVLD